MIRKVTTYAQCEEFVSVFFTDESFSDPMMLTDEQLQHNLIKSINQTDRHDVIGVYHDEELIGLFAFLLLKDENYLEMLVGLSREENAYREMFSYLDHNYAGYKADFVFNPNNTLLKKLLIEKNAEFDTEQQKMLFTSPIPTIDTTGVELLSEKYHAQYCAMHTQDMYWVGEKVIAAPERFRTLVAIHKD